MKVKFKDIGEGIIFKYNTHTFIRIENIDTMEYGHINVVCLDNGQVDELAPSDEIEI